MDLLEVMRCTPSTRRFTHDTVDVAVVERALENARFAPSGGNRQPWRVIVIGDPDTRRTLRDLYWPPWEAYVRARGGDPEGPIGTLLSGYQAGPDASSSVQMKQARTARRRHISVNSHHGRVVAH